MAPGSHELARTCFVRFLDESCNPVAIRRGLDRCSALNVTVARFRLARDDAKSHQPPIGRRRRRFAHHFMETRHIANQMIRRQYQHDAFRIRFNDAHRGHRHRWSSIATRWLENLGRS